MRKQVCIIRVRPQRSNTPPLWGELAKEKPDHASLLCSRVFDFVILLFAVVCQPVYEEFIVFTLVLEYTETVPK